MGNFKTWESTMTGQAYHQEHLDVSRPPPGYYWNEDTDGRLSRAEHEMMRREWARENPDGHTATAARVRDIVACRTERPRASLVGTW